MQTCPPGTLCPSGQPDYFGVPNYANTKPLQKFVNTLAGLGSGNANNLGQFIPVATPFSTPPLGVPADGDYYEIGLRNYTQVFHSDLAATPTLLRGYYDKNPNTQDGNSNHYLGPLIIAQKDRPVRVKFFNELPTTPNPGSNLFIPVDSTYMGAGMGMNGQVYTQNRATLHLHGGVTAWTSDGTPHQWITPAGETGGLVQGVSQQSVPDMPLPQPGDGTATFYWTNQQSARLMFFHDHSYGITRLNVYAGEAAGYLIVDNYEKDMIEGTNQTGINPNSLKAIPDLGGVYHYGIPLIIQDKTFVPPPAQLAVEDNTWDPALWGGEGNLWFPHIYTPNQNPGDESGANAFGRWDWGPWFWPPQDPSKLKLQPYACSSAANPNNISGQWMCPGLPSPVSGTPEAFMDTPVINGTAYPTFTVDPKPYRFRILNAGNDRTINLSLFQADPTLLPGSPGYGKEVKMVPAVPTTGWPATWPTDGRDGGVPDPATMGPSFIQIGSEGGFLPAPVVVPPQPVGYIYDRRNIVVLNIGPHGLLLGPAERADVIVDFSAFAGKTLILYNDAPAPVPAFDPRIDYYTGDPDMTAMGGAATTQPGYGPNTRTMMQIVVSAGAPATFDPTNLNVLLPKTFVASQAQPVVPEKAYNADYGTNLPNTYSRIQNTSLTFVPFGGTTPVTMQMGAKAIQELFSLDYGRMNATLGTELPFTSFNNQTTVPLAYVDPPTETVQGATPQLWKITHNGVDTHFIHFHLFNVQVINRVGWDGNIRPPDANELGWKETVRMNPLEDVIVAVNPIVPNVPFPVPDSTRLLDVTCAQNATNANGGCNFSDFDPASGNPITTINAMTNFGWEYVWHCHILGHEENDMMRPMVLQMPMQAPMNLGAAWTTGGAIIVAFTDTTLSETGFTLQRALDSGFTQSLVVTPLPANQAPPGFGPVLYSDTGVTPGALYYYRVRAFNATATSAWSNTAQSQQTQNITFQPIGNVTYGVPPIALVATATSGLPVTFTVSGPATVNGSLLTITGAGTVIVQANQAGNLNILPANSVQQTVTVSPALLTLTANNASIPQGSPLPTFTYVITGFVNGDTQGTAISGSPSLTTTAPQNPPAGTYPIIAAQGSLAAPNYTFTFVNGTLTVTVVIAQITSPAPGSTLTGSTVTFTWNAGTGATGYWLDIGNVAGGNQYYQSGNMGNVLTTTVNGLPTNGSTVYATLYSLVGGQWVSNPSTYTAFNTGTAKGVITNPAPGSTLTGSSVTFNWTAGTGSSAYWLDIGNAPGGNQYYQSGNLGNVLTTTATALPTDGSTVYATLYSLVGGQWQSNAYTYTAFNSGSAKGVITTPAPGSTLTASTVTFNWTAGTSSTAYWMDIGKVAGGNQYFQSGNMGNVLAVTVNNLPTDGSAVYVTLYSLVGGQWVSNAYTYTAYNNASNKGVITTPTPGSTLSGTLAAFTWSAGTQSTAYWLDIGNVPGGNQYYQSGNLGNVLTTTVSSLPANSSTIYVTLYSYVGGQWLNNQYQYVSGP